MRRSLAAAREALLLAKEACEDFGFEVLHLFVDAFMVRQPGYRAVADFQRFWMKFLAEPV
jgi:DNA polymerase elongation subunit (family B)